MKKFYPLIISGYIHVNPDACTFDCLTNLVMLKTDESSSRKIKIKKRAVHLTRSILSSHNGETDMKQITVEQVGDVKDRVLKSEYVRIHREKL